MYQDNFFRELIIDNFAGGGGASVGIELALGEPVDIAINHDADAIAMHKVNHPYTLHYQEDVFAIDPEEVTRGRRVGVAWFSPDCKHFSRAKGGKPVDKKIRGLSWVVLKWALSSAAPRVFFMENVPEIQTWGPLKEINGKLYPDSDKAGQTFDGFIAMLTHGVERDHPAFEEACEFLQIKTDSDQAERLLKGLGYEVKWKEIKACDYGAPTIRKRFYLVARRDGLPIVFPEPTHGNGKGLKPYRTAAECIDWSISCPSIFGRKKPLAVNTLRRIAKGIDKFVIRNPKPFIVPVGYGERLNQQPRVNDINTPLSTIVSTCKQGLCTPSLMQYHTEQTNGEVRGQTIDSPIMTVDSSNRYAVNTAFLSKYFSGEQQAGANLLDPVPTVTSIDHNSLVTGTIVKYYSGSDQFSAINDPLHTVTTKDRHGIAAAHLAVFRRNMDGKNIDDVMPTLTTSAGHMAQVRTYLEKIDTAQNLGHWNEIRELLNTYAGYSINDNEILLLELNGVKYFISDIGLRMLKAKELKLAQGFPPDYIIDIEPYIGKKYSEAKQIARLGNAVCPPVATALIRANCAEIAIERKLTTMKALNAVLNGRKNAVKIGR